MLTTRATSATQTAGEGVRRDAAAAAAHSGSDGNGGFLAAFVTATEGFRSPSAGVPTAASPATPQLPARLPAAQPTTAQLPVGTPTAQPAAEQDDNAEQPSGVAAAARTAPPAAGRDGGATRRPATLDIAGLSAGLLGPADIEAEPGTPTPASVTGQSPRHRNDHDLRQPPSLAGGAVAWAAPVAQAVASPAPTAPGAPIGDPVAAIDPNSPPSLADPDIPTARFSEAAGNDALPAGGNAPVPGTGSGPPDPATTTGVAAATDGTVSASAMDPAGGALLSGLGAPVSARGDSSTARGSSSAVPGPGTPAGAAPAGAAAQPLGGVAVAPASALADARFGHGGRFDGALSDGGATGAGPSSATNAVVPASSPQAGTDGTGSDVPGLVQQIAQHVVGALGGGRLEAVLQLHPPELGELSVRIEVSGHDVSAWFDSPLPQVQQALSQEMGQLQAGLANAGYNLNGAWVGGDAWTPRGGRSAPLAPPPARIPDATQIDAVPGTAAPTTRMGVSLYV
jgi:hypothetical protein